MDAKTPALELVPLEAKAPATAPAVAVPDVPPQVVASVDKYFAAARAEFKKGDIDQTLWDRVLAEAKGDREKAIPNYLRTRATSLKLLKREPRTINYAPMLRDFEEPPAPSVVANKVAASEADEAVPSAWKFDRRVVTIAAAGGGVLVCAALLYLFLGSASSPKPDVASAASPANRSVMPAPAPAVRPVSKDTPETSAANKASQELIAKIEALRIAGNWHVLVLYAGEWTRREAWNAAAWNELSLGYERLRQFDDAYNAATKAVTLAPEVALYWRNLGQLDVELNLLEEALRAYEGAAALDGRDEHSLVQAGLLYWRLARLPEAKAASDKALALSPDDPDAVCLKALIASRPVAPKAVSTAARPPGPREVTCREITDAKDAPVVANSSTTATAAVPRKR